MIVVQPSKRIERHQTVPPADEDHAGLGLLDELVVGEQLQDFPRIHLFRGEMLELRKWISLLPPVKADVNMLDSSIFTADAQLPPCL